MDGELSAAYETCRRLHRRADPTYYWATRRLPPELRPATHALYGYVRTADDIVDGPGRPADRRARLDAWEDELLRRDRATHPIVRALADAESRHGLELGELESYLRSMRKDCGPVRIETVEELEEYMNGSAGSVGRIMAPLLGAPRSARGDFGRLGLAFQLTNFLRDVREDRSLDRVYLPQRERFGVPEEDFDRPTASPSLRALVAEEVRRARSYFESAGPAIAAAAPSVRPGMRLAVCVYGRVLDQIESSGHDVLGARTAPAPWRLAPAAVGALVRREVAA